MRGSLATRWRFNSQSSLASYSISYELRRIVDVLQKAHLGAAEHLIERRRGLDHGGELAGITRWQREAQLQCASHLRRVVHGLVPICMAWFLFESLPVAMRRIDAENFERLRL